MNVDEWRAWVAGNKARRERIQNFRPYLDVRERGVWFDYYDEYVAFEIVEVCRLTEDEKPLHNVVFDSGAVPRDEASRTRAEMWRMVGIARKWGLRNLIDGNVLARLVA